MMAKLSSLLNNTSHPLQDSLTALGSSFSERLLHPRCVKERLLVLPNLPASSDENIYRRNRKHLLKTGERDFLPTDAKDKFTYSGIETNNTKSDGDCKVTEVTSEADAAAGPVQSQLYHTRVHQESSEVPSGPSGQTHLDFIFMLLEENIVTFVKNELKKIQKVLTSDYPECLESQREDEEVLDGEDEEQRRSSREAFLKITLHFLRRMKQEELADCLQSKLLVPVCQRKLKSHLQKKFQELNVLKEKKFSLVELVHQFFTETKEAGICRFEEFQVVFIFDGLDECRLPLDFHNNEILTDVTESTSVDVLLTNLIRGKLLPSARLWITTRPAAANQIPPECVDMVTEVRGFTDPQKEEYFRKRFRNEGAGQHNHLPHQDITKPPHHVPHPSLLLDHCYSSGGCVENQKERRAAQDPD
ncbi:hypothetical protein L3Q82_000863 [Scortum barcoo]|uniref:Uncharacterized protein n=1 Tax=Scortum barcoo TaxID=214431 RepID=A0ACB8WDM2_9TELE|nr:hypothetical protein L3Q82_000863 [Scortum barcoo]